MKSKNFDKIIKNTPGHVRKRVKDYLDKLDLEHNNSIVVNEYKNIPPTEIMDAIHNQCFDAMNRDIIINGLSVQDRIYLTWQLIHKSLKIELENNSEFVNYILNNEPDLEKFK